MVVDVDVVVDVDGLAVSTAIVDGGLLSTVVVDDASVDVASAGFGAVAVGRLLVQPTNKPTAASKTDARIRPRNDFRLDELWRFRARIRVTKAS